MKNTCLLSLCISLLILFFACEVFEDPLITDPRDNFTGDWSVNEISSLYGTTNYNVKIVKDPNNSSQVIIKNFYHFGMDMDTYAIVTIGTITVPEQIVCNHTVQGFGKLDKNRIQWTYTANDGADIDNVTATYTKQ